ncbi:MAG: after-VIT domain-containing protein, partial [Microcoleus sp. T3-bin5]|nr:after-VIT domain-containing protein [Microcoleus sp. T3-bin5]
YEGIFESEGAEGTRGGTLSSTSIRPMAAVNPSAGRLSLQEDSQLPLQKPLAPRLQVVSAEGLDAGAIAALTQYLQSVNLPARASGETVWELSVQDGRVARVAIDTQTSTLQATDAVETLKSALSSWQPPAGFKGTLRLKLRIIVDR